MNKKVGDIRKLKFKVLTAILVMLLGVFMLVSCSYESVIELRDINLQYTPDNSIKQLSGDRSEELLDNIDRGFRLETYYTLGSGRAWPTDEGSDGYKMLEEELDFYKDGKPVEFKYIFI
ncbi:MAG: hypothetical protein K2P12_03455 [Clostridia bacterium]|nr:hypothetical protein [Clostridia bacterium]